MFSKVKLYPHISSKISHFIQESIQLEPGYPWVAYWRGRADLWFAITNL